MTDDTPKHPGRILFEQAMTPLGVSRNKLARDIDVPVGRISDIVAGKRGVTPDTALRFAKYFGTTAELWLRLQADYDLHVARTTTWPKAEPKVAVLEPSSDPVPAFAPASAPVAVQPHSPSPSSQPAADRDDAPDETGSTAYPPENNGRDDGSVAADADDDDQDIDIPEPAPGGQR